MLKRLRSSEKPKKKEEKNHKIKKKTDLRRKNILFWLRFVADYCNDKKKFVQKR